MISGRCECGAVTFQIKGELKPPTACHCSQCRRLSGHFWAGTWAQLDDLRFINKDGLTWFQSSDWAERGFCKSCGSSLFYRLRDDNSRISVAAGSLGKPTGLQLYRHIYVADKGDYYDITDGLPQLKEH